MPANPELLRDVPLFQPLVDGDRAAIATIMEDCFFPAQTVLFKENDPGGILYVVIQGQIELYVTNPQGEKVVIGIMDPGEFFGEMSLLDGGTRSTSARALTDVQAVALEHDDFLALLGQRSDIALSVLRALTLRLRRTDDLVRAHVRNANEVAEAKETIGDRIADGVARFAGSWSFIIGFIAFLAFWIAIATALGGQSFDPYPYILLSLILNMLAAFQAPIIMMSQNRQDAKDRVRNDLEYDVNVRAELEILQLTEKVDQLQRYVSSRLG